MSKGEKLGGAGDAAMDPADILADVEGISLGDLDNNTNIFNDESAKNHEADSASQDRGFKSLRAFYGKNNGESAADTAAESDNASKEALEQAITELNAKIREKTNALDNLYETLGDIYLNLGEDAPEFGEAKDQITDAKGELSALEADRDAKRADLRKLEAQLAPEAANDSSEIEKKKEEVKKKLSLKQAFKNIKKKAIVKVGAVVLGGIFVLTGLAGKVKSAADGPNPVTVTAATADSISGTRGNIDHNSPITLDNLGDDTKNTEAATGSAVTATEGAISATDAAINAVSKRNASAEPHISDDKYEDRDTEINLEKVSGILNGYNRPGMYGDINTLGKTFDFASAETLSKEHDNNFNEMLRDVDTSEVEALASYIADLDDWVKQEFFADFQGMNFHQAEVALENLANTDEKAFNNLRSTFNKLMENADTTGQYMQGNLNNVYMYTIDKTADLTYDNTGLAYCQTYESGALMIKKTLTNEATGETSSIVFRVMPVFREGTECARLMKNNPNALTGVSLDVIERDLDHYDGCFQPVSEKPMTSLPEIKPDRKKPTPKPKDDEEKPVTPDDEKDDDEKEPTPEPTPIVEEPDLERDDGTSPTITITPNHNDDTDNNIPTGPTIKTVTGTSITEGNPTPPSGTSITGENPVDNPERPAENEGENPPYIPPSPTPVITPQPEPEPEPQPAPVVTGTSVTSGSSIDSPQPEPENPTNSAITPTPGGINPGGNNTPEPGPENPENPEGPETLEAKDPAKQIENAGEFVDQQPIDNTVTPPTDLEDDQENFKAIEEQEKEDAEKEAEAAKRAAEQAEAEKRAAEEAERRKQEEEAARQAELDRLKDEEERKRAEEEAAAAQAAADEAARVGAEQASEQATENAEQVNQQQAEEAAREQAQEQANEQAKENEEEAAEHADDSAGERGNIFDNGGY